MKVIGITGGTGAGKTTLLRAFESLGAAVIDCDSVYHGLLRDDANLLDAIERRFPGTVIDGVLDRKLLGKRVFASEEEIEALNRIAWPFVDRKVAKILKEEELHGRRLAAVDAIGLFESGLAELCGATLFVTAPREVRLRRIMERDGVSEEYASARIDAQKPDGFFEARCTRTVINDFDSEEAFFAHCSEYITNLFLEANEMADLKKELFYEQKNAYDMMDEQDLERCEEYCAAYMRYMDASKTEREAVTEAVRLAELAGFRAYDGDGELKPGDKIYRNVRGKLLLLAVIGERPLSEGCHICASHIDSPRLDLKQLPLYEDTEVAYLKTHYYGGVRKYQWVTVPLELHGVVAMKDGTVKEIKIGPDPSDPVFYISDLLPHLGRSQSEKPLGKAIPGENLNIMLGSRPLKLEGGEKQDKRVKLQVLKLLNEKYGITEEDFLSAEIEAVPAYNAREVGLDRSLIGAYAHDDRVCAYAELAAILGLDKPSRTAVCILTDKEEVGSMGVSGMQSHAFECFMEDICEAGGVKLRRCLEKSLCISADVTAAFDPCWPEVFEKRNNCKLNYGVAIMKFTGHGGKSGASDASAEVVGRIRRIMAENNIVWQMGEIGKVDEGGGGTVALYMANRDIETIDAGVPVIAMHAPWEIVAKADCYMTYRTMKAVYEEK